MLLKNIFSTIIRNKKSMIYNNDFLRVSKTTRFLSSVENICLNEKFSRFLKDATKDYIFLVFHQHHGK